VAPAQEAETPVVRGGVLERVPEADGGGRRRVQEHRVLVRRHGAADRGLLADDHGLQDLGLREAEGGGDGGRGGRRRNDVGCREGVADCVERRGEAEEGAEGGGEGVEGVADFVDGAGFGVFELARGVEGVWEWLEIWGLRGWE